MPELSLRPVTPEEFPDFLRACYRSFGDEPHDGDDAREQAVFEFDRSLGAFDGGTPVATSACFTTCFRVPGADVPGAGVPGGDVPTAFVTWVGVHRAYRRRGLLSRMMAGLLEGARAREEPLAGLFASEGGIYGRFGFGVASSDLTLRLNRRHSAFRSDTVSGGTLRAVPLEGAGTPLTEVYERARDRWTVMPSRRQGWLDYQVLADPEHLREGHGSKDVVVHERDGRLEGYVVSRVKPGWSEGGPTGTLEVVEMVALTPEAAAALWRYCLDADLCEEVVARLRPVDDPLGLLVADPGRVRAQLHDGMWLRLVDLPRALEARTWTGSGRVVLDVADGFLPDNAGTWALAVDEGRATCTRSDAPAQLRLGTEALAATYFGAIRPSELAAAGRLDVLDADALARLEALIGRTATPWGPEVF